MDNKELMVVFEGTPVEVDLLKSLLDGSQITCFIKDETMGRFAPFYTSVGGQNPVKLVVPKNELDNAKPVVEEFIKNRKA